MKSFFTGNGILLKLFAFTILYLQVLLASSETKLVTSENDYFEIIGTDLRSVSFLNDLSVFTASVILNELSFSFKDPPRKVLGRLREFDDVDSYSCPISEDGSITLNFNWNESLSLEQAIEGITIAFIQSYCFSNFGNQFLDQTIYKAWSIQCLSALVEIRLRPKTEKLFWSDSETNTLSVEFFDHSFFSSDRVVKKNAFLIWEIIKASPFSKKEKRGLFFKSFQGMNVLEMLNAAYQKKLNDPNFNFYAGKLFFEQAQYEISERYLINALKLKGPVKIEIQALILLGRIELERGNFDKAIIHLNQSLKKNKIIAESFYYLGKTYLYKRNKDKAAEYFLKAIELDKSYLEKIKK